MIKPFDDPTFEALKRGDIIFTDHEEKRLIATVESLKGEIYHLKIVVVDQEEANNKLKEDYYAPTVTIKGLRVENEKLEEENAKLKSMIKG